MRNSCRFAVAVHVLAVLAYKEGQPVTSRMLATSVNTNPVVIRRLLLTLQNANLIATRKGAGQGSCLSRAPKDIKLSEVYRAVDDGEAFALPRKDPNPDCPVGHCIQVALGKVFASAQAALERELNRATLADVVKSMRAECGEGKGRAK